MIVCVSMLFSKFERLRYTVNMIIFDVMNMFHGETCLYLYYLVESKKYCQIIIAICIRKYCDLNFYSRNMYFTIWNYATLMFYLILINFFFRNFFFYFDKFFFENGLAYKYVLMDSNGNKLWEHLPNRRYQYGFVNRMMSDITSKFWWSNKVLVP